MVAFLGKFYQIEDYIGITYIHEKWVCDDYKYDFKKL